MARPVILCADGSEQSTAAIAAGVELVGGGDECILVTVVEPADPLLVTGAGHAGGVMTPEQYERSQQAVIEEARAILVDARRSLGLADAQAQILEGSPGPAICQYAEQVDARAVVMGTRGRGGLRRAVLGSVSDHVVRKAPCPVVVVNDGATDADEGADPS